MNTPPVVSAQEWEAARQQLLVKEKALTRARDALAAERRRMPWLAVEKAYKFDGPKGKASLLDLFDGRRQLIVYRAFFEPGVFGWPEHACRGCSLGADQVAHLAHLNARDTTLAYASRAPQADIARLKARMGWEMPWYTITDSFDEDFGVDEWHGHNVFFRDGDNVFRTYFINNRGDEAMGTTWSYLDITPLGRQETWEDSPEGYPQTPPYKWWNWHDNYDAKASPDPKWVEVSDAGEAAFRKRDERDGRPGRTTASVIARLRKELVRCVELARRVRGMAAKRSLTTHGFRSTLRDSLRWRLRVALRSQRDADDRLVHVHVGDGRDADAGRLDDVDGVDADARTDVARRGGVVPRHVGRDDGGDDAAVPGAHAAALPPGRRQDRRERAWAR